MGIATPISKPPALPNPNPNPHPSPHRAKRGTLAGKIRAAMGTGCGHGVRAIRLFVGLTFLGLGTALDTPWGLLGLIPMLTAGLGFCPLYPLLGINTCEDSH